MLSMMFSNAVDSSEGASDFINESASQRLARSTVLVYMSLDTIASHCSGAAVMISYTSGKRLLMNASTFGCHTDSSNSSFIVLAICLDSVALRGLNIHSDTSFFLSFSTTTSARARSALSHSRARARRRAAASLSCAARISLSRAFSAFASLSRSTSISLIVSSSSRAGMAYVDSASSLLTACGAPPACVAGSLVSTERSAPRDARTCAISASWPCSSPSSSASSSLSSIISPYFVCLDPGSYDCSRLTYCSRGSAYSVTPYAFCWSMMLACFALSSCTPMFRLAAVCKAS